MFLFKGAYYTDVLSNGILHLTEDATISKLKEKWWKYPNDKTCDTKSENEDENKLGLKNVGGVFLLLILGCTLSFFVALLEFLWNVRKVAVREKVTIFII